MAENIIVDLRSYGGKHVAIVEDHEVAIIPWSNYRRTVKIAPILVTLDYHTDTNNAFGRSLP